MGAQTAGEAGRVSDRALDSSRSSACSSLWFGAGTAVRRGPIGVGQARAVAKHTASIFLRLGRQQSDDDNRRVLAVLAYLGT